MTSTDEELIRHRIKKRLSGRRDLILHLLVYLLVTALVWISVPWWDLRGAGALWRHVGDPVGFECPALLLSMRSRPQETR